MALFKNADIWSPRTPWPWSRGISGERLGPFVMGRKIDGRWEYRDMTEAEATEWQASYQGY